MGECWAWPVAPVRLPHSSEACHQQGFTRPSGTISLATGEMQTLLPRVVLLIGSPDAVLGRWEGTGTFQHLLEGLDRGPATLVRHLAEPEGSWGGAIFNEQRGLPLRAKSTRVSKEDPWLCFPSQPPGVRPGHEILGLQ